MTDPHEGHTILCVLVDDHPGVIDALAQVLPAEGIGVVGRAGTGAEALEVIGRVPATVALVDLALPDTNGIDLSRDLITAHPGLSIVLYAADVTSGGARLARETGVRGVVLKESGIGELIGAIRTVSGGGIHVDRRLSALAAPGPA